jgi:predicted enzyme related to lactoylglutathione lyase
MSKNTICHVEWPTTDFERVKTFYGTLFDWKFQSWGDQSYLLFESAGGVGGGFWKVDKVEASQGPVVYIQVDEIEPYLNQADAMGGSRGEIMEIPNIGWSAVIKDPDGNQIGLFKSAHGG